ncbi:MAG TPA: YbjN domain-containing protein [Abditibacteriaceae bacterium]|jgi:hypothetical protein
MSTLLTEDAVSNESIFELFRSAFMRVELDDDGDVRVHTENGPRIWVLVDSNRHHLRFLCSYRFDSEATEYQKMEFANKLNDTVVMVRFAIDGDSLVVDYYLSYEEGILPYHIVAGVRRMSKIVTSAIAENDVQNIVL